MFSGITQGLFSVSSLNKRPDFCHYTVILNKDLLANLKVGYSVSIDGVCQTVVKIKGVEVSFEAIRETLEKTTLGQLFIARKVSVERSVRLGDEIGGHEVSGHIFETGILLDRKKTKHNLCITIRCSETCFAFIIPKGYIAIDGSSLTVDTLNKENCSFQVHLVPETLRKTNFLVKDVGEKVNLEPDMKTMVLAQAAKNYYLKMQNQLDELEKQMAYLKIRSAL